MGNAIRAAGRRRDPSATSRVGCPFMLLRKDEAPSSVTEGFVQRLTALALFPLVLPERPPRTERVAASWQSSRGRDCRSRVVTGQPARHRASFPVMPIRCRPCPQRSCHAPGQQPLLRPRHIDPHRPHGTRIAQGHGQHRRLVQDGPRIGLHRAAMSGSLAGSARAECRRGRATDAGLAPQAAERKPEPAVQAQRRLLQCAGAAASTYATDSATSAARHRSSQARALSGRLRSR